MASEPFPWREFADAMEAFELEQSREERMTSEPLPIHEYLDRERREISIGSGKQIIRREMDNLIEKNAVSDLVEICEEYLAIARKREAA